MENDRLVVTIDDLGAELVSIYDKKYSRELIWQGDPAWWKRQAPILFPNVGKFYGGEYLYQGRHSDNITLGNHIIICDPPPVCHYLRTDK